MVASSLLLLLSITQQVQRLSLLLQPMQPAVVSNGSLTLGAVTGGVAPYTYSVDGSAFTATPVYNNLAAGTHTLM